MLAKSLWIVYLLCMVNLYSTYKMSRYANIYTPSSMSSFYPSMLRLLYSINSGLRKDGILAPGSGSLQNTKKLYELIGQPLDSIPTIHVGGTNGKGTTSLKVSECLRHSGYTTGLFVSPHIASFRERVQVNTQLIPEESFVSHLKTLLELCASHEIPATEFELSFLLASLHFKQSKCQAVVLEVGCGGLFDATNVVNTAASVICSVSLDHTRILGATIEEIAWNKAGIFKRHTPALVGPDVPLAVVKKVAEEQSTPLLTYEEAKVKYCSSNYIDKQQLIFSNHDNDNSDDSITDTDNLNSDLSLLTLCMLKEHCDAFHSLNLQGEGVKQGIQCRPPCRWETFEHSVSVEAKGSVGVKVVLDMGHNPAAVSALTRRIKRDFAHYSSVRVVYAMSRDKDVRACLTTLLSAVPHDHIHFVQSDNFRAISREELSELFKAETGKEMTQLQGTTTREILSEVFQLSAGDVISIGSGREGSAEAVVVVCGTGYIMPETKAFLGIVEPRDAVDLKRQES